MRGARCAPPLSAAVDWVHALGRTQAACVALWHMICCCCAHVFVFFAVCDIGLVSALLLVAVHVLQPKCSWSESSWHARVLWLSSGVVASCCANLIWLVVATAPQGYPQRCQGIKIFFLKFSYRRKTQFPSWCAVYFPLRMQKPWQGFMAPRSSKLG